MGIYMKTDQSDRISIRNKFKNIENSVDILNEQIKSSRINLMALNQETLDLK